MIIARRRSTSDEANDLSTRNGVGQWRRVEWEEDAGRTALCLSMIRFGVVLFAEDARYPAAKTLRPHRRSGRLRIARQS